jgi:hypothetical protein
MDRWLFNSGLNFLKEYPEKISELTWVKLLAYWRIDVFPSKNPVSATINNYQGIPQYTVDEGSDESQG